MLKGFRDFILRGNVVDLAVAVVIGAAFNNIISALVKDLITPLIAALGGQPDFSRLSFSINNSKFMIGDFINSLVSFLIISSVVYFFIVAPMNKIMKKFKKSELAEDKEKTCPECLSKIPKNAKRCRFCTSILKEQ